MMLLLFKRTCITGVAFISFSLLNAQHLSFTPPALFLPDAITDKAVDIAVFNGIYFLAWKELGNTGNVKFSCLGKQYDTATAGSSVTVPGQQTAWAPLLQVLAGRVYLFWISTEGRLKYIINNSNNGFNTTAVYEMHFTNSVTLSQGITTTAINGKLMIATHAGNKDQLIYCMLQPGNDGHFADAEALIMSEARSGDYPFVVGLTNELTRFCWEGKNQSIYYADYNIVSGVWTQSLPLVAKTKTAPAVYQIWNAGGLLYIWNSNKNDGKMYYASANEKEPPGGGTALPDVFSTSAPVSVCQVDDNNFLLAYTGADHHVYLSNFSSYDPASWMRQILGTQKSTKTLQDIVIPGAHDAGMSILNGVGGQQSETINNCNTLTQKMNIEQQLNAGVRMFDLRIGTYQQQLLTKHSNADCMEDAIGGGYGERLRDVADGIRRFLLKNNQEVVLITFSHFCEKETPGATVRDSLLNRIGKELVYNKSAESIGLVPLNKLAGKVVITFEASNSSDRFISSSSIADRSAAFINFRRQYAATDDIKKLLEKEQIFFSSFSSLQNNDLVRVDWQLTQTTDEAPLICNDFQDDKISPIVNGVMLLANVVRKHKSIIDHSLAGNKYLPVSLNEWINSGIINKKNRPHILYVDVAGTWITDYCIDLNKTALYK